MARYQITTTVDAAQLPSVKKTLAKAFGKNEADIFAVEKIKTAESRADRLSAAGDEVENAKSAVEELRDKMQEWYDSIPENLQNGNKAEEVQSAIDELDSLISDMENLDFSSVSFPGMMG